ncbi:MAG: hypothetical protein RLZZ234_545 [Candidatus Parcubacteria bacterium]
MKLVLFREDLRLDDNPALVAASARHAPLLCAYMHDTTPSRPLGAASKWWLHHALTSLSASLEEQGGVLHILSGDPALEVAAFIREHGITEVHINRRYDVHGRASDAALAALCETLHVPLHTHDGGLLHAPELVQNKSGTHFKVFTPFKNAVYALPKREAHAQPKVTFKKSQSLLGVSNLNLLPIISWDKGFKEHWPEPTEAGAHARLTEFLEESSAVYKAARDIPSREHTSRLSPYLRFGQISPIRVWHRTQEFITTHKGASEGAWHFLSELCWREFSYHLLVAEKNVVTTPMKEEFARYPWQQNKTFLRAWQKGETGVPIVDAGMRQLWHTGWMHNRVRMVVASYLIKNLNISWQEGEAWFWDTLLDADPASNPVSWQWVAGCGMDAAPFFRIFNPVTQAEKFDAEGTYIKTWVPELAKLGVPDLFAPWAAGPIALASAGVTLGETYPNPHVDLKESREAALLAYKTLKT